MSDPQSLDELSWIVLTNDAGELSLWPACVPAPEGWSETGPEGDRETCCAWIDAHWAAMQPRREGGP